MNQRIEITFNAAGDIPTVHDIDTLTELMLEEIYGRVIEEFRIGKTSRDNDSDAFVTSIILELEEKEAT